MTYYVSSGTLNLTKLKLKLLGSNLQSILGLNWQCKVVGLSGLVNEF